MVRLGQLVMCCVLLVGSAVGANNIYGYSADGVYHIDQQFKRCTISSPGTYVFWAEDGSALGQIDKIRVDSGIPGSPGVVGKITVSVYDWNAGPGAAGAQNVAWVDFTNAKSGGRIGIFRIAGDYGNVDPDLGGPVSAVVADTVDIAGDVVAPSAVAKAIRVTSWVSGSVVLGNVKSPVSLPTVSGDVTIHDVQSPVTLRTVRGTLTVEGAVTAPLDCQHSGADVRLTAAGVTHTADITLNSIAAGCTFWCAGNLSSGSQLSIQTVEPGALVQLDQNAGSVHVGELADDAQVGGTLAIKGNVKQLEVDDIAPLGAVYVGGEVLNALDLLWGGDVTLVSLIRELTDTTAVKGRAYVGSLSGTLHAPGVTGRLAVDELTSSGALTLDSVNGGRGHCGLGRTGHSRLRECRRAEPGCRVGCERIPLWAGGDYGPGGRGDRRR